MSLPPVVVLGLDSPVGLVAVREFGRRGVPVIGIGYHLRSLGRGSRHLCEFIVRPEGPVSTWLPRLLKSRRAAAVLPMKDRDIRALARLGEDALGCVVLGAAAEPFETVLDKAKTLAAARECGIETPRNWQPVCPDEPLPNLGWPAVVKWADPLSVMGALEQAGLPETKAEYYTDEAGLRAGLRRYAAVGRLPMVQEYCRGRGLGQHFYMEGRRATLFFQHERVHEWPPEGGVSSLCRAVPPERHAAQRARSEALLRHIGWEGFAMVEYRYDEASERHLLMEVNGHLWGSLPLASACGAEFAWEAYRRRVLGATAPLPVPRDDLYARDTIKETMRVARQFLKPRDIADPCYRPTRWQDLARYVWGFFDPYTRSYVFSWRDPLPAVVALLGTAERSWARLLARVRRSPMTSVHSPVRKAK